MYIYLSGKIRGASEEQLFQFTEAAIFFRKQNYGVFNPLEEETGDPREIFARDSSILCLKADILITLEGSETSLGALAEQALARAVGIPVLTYENERKRHE